MEVERRSVLGDNLDTLDNPGDNNENSMKSHDLYKFGDWLNTVCSWPWRHFLQAFVSTDRKVLSLGLLPFQSEKQWHVVREVPGSCRITTYLSQTPNLSNTISSTTKWRQWHHMVPEFLPAIKANGLIQTGFCKSLGALLACMHPCAHARICVCMCVRGRN